VTTVLAAQEKHLRLNILLHQEDGCWVAHCPELGTLAADPDYEIAWEDAVRLCRAALTHGLNRGRDLRDIVKPPPANIAEIIASAREDGFLRLHLQARMKDGTELTVHRVLRKAA
jgi:hypothetical protein